MPMMMPTTFVDLEENKEQQRAIPPMPADGMGGYGQGGMFVPTRQAQAVDLDTPTFSERFINYVEKVEGIYNEKGGEKGRTPFRYPSKEGGLDTVGIGHKLTQDQIDSNSVYNYDLDTLTQEQVDLIFVKDLELTVKGLDTVLQKEHNTSYKDLTPKQQEMLLDFHFNVKTGIKAFPEFTKGVIKNDLPKMRKEYLRYMKDPDTRKMVLLGRNKIFYDTYLK